MDAPDRFEIIAGRGFFRPDGCVSLETAVDMVTAAIAYARAQGICELMANASSLTGFESPSISERFFFVEKWASVAGGAVRLAMVVRPEMIDPKKFGVTVAMNRGLIGDVFVSEAEAVAWLDSLRHRLKRKRGLTQALHVTGRHDGFPQVQRVTAYAYSADGVRIAYEVTGEGEPTLLFVHGWSCDRSYWQAQVQHLGRQYRVVTIDLAGHGESGLNRAEWTIQAFAADVVAVLEQLDVATAVLIGHSLGGPIVLEAGIRAPDRVLGVIAVEAFFDDWSLIDPEPFRGNFVDTTTAFVKSMFLPESDRDLIERIAPDMASGPSTVGIGALEGVRKWAADDFDRAFREIRTPVRMIQRERTPDLLTKVRGHVPSLSSFDIAVMPGVSHFAMIEQPQAFNRLLEGFVNGLQRSV